jgi:hypothetical protein
MRTPNFYPDIFELIDSDPHHSIKTEGLESTIKKVQAYTGLNYEQADILVKLFLVEFRRCLISKIPFIFHSHFLRKVMYSTGNNMYRIKMEEMSIGPTELDYEPRKK